MSQAAAVLNEPDLSKDFASKAEQLKEKINEDWWSLSEKRFADFISDQQKAVQLIDMALQERVIPKRMGTEGTNNLERADIERGA